MSKGQAYPFPPIHRHSHTDETLREIKETLKDLLKGQHDTQLALKDHLKKEEFQQAHEKITHKMGEMFGALSVVQNRIREIQENQVPAEIHKENTYEAIRSYLEKDTVVTTLSGRIDSRKKKIREGWLENLSYIPRLFQVVKDLVISLGAILAVIYVLSHFWGTPIQTQFIQQPTQTERGK